MFTGYFYFFSNKYVEQLRQVYSDENFPSNIPKQYGFEFL